MKILLLSYEFPPLGGGGSRVVFGLGHAYARLGHQPHVLTMGYKGLPARESVDGMRVFRVPGIRRLQSRCSAVEMVPYLLIGLVTAVRLTRRHRYDCLHTHFIFPDALIAYTLNLLFKVPYIVTAHGSDVPGYNPNRFILLHKILAPLWQYLVKRIPHIVFPSQSLQHLFRQASLSRPRSSVIPNGIDGNKYRADRPKGNLILLVTRIFERKGIQYFIEAARHLRADYHIHIVGDGPYLRALKQMARGLPLPVTFHGFIDNSSPILRDLFETARFFVFTSEVENFPIVLLEAMLAGTTIISTKGTGCAEVVGEAACLVRPRAPQEILETLEELIQDPERSERLGRRARERVESHFIWETVARRYLDLLNDITAART